MLLDNTPEYLFWLGAAAVSRSVIVGINATYRGAELARLIDHCDCQVLVTSDAYADLLADAPSQVDREHVFDTDDDHYRDLLARDDGARRWEPAAVDDLYLLIFTSGSTGFPKAVRCTQGRFARTGVHVAGVAQLGPGAAVYAPLPFFHSSSLFTGLASALQASVPFGTAHEVLGVADDARHPPHRRHDDGVHGQGAELRPGGATVTGRRRVPVAARIRQRGVGVRHPGVRRPLPLRRPRQLWLHRGTHHHPPRPVDAVRRARTSTGRHHRACTTPTPARNARGPEFDADGRLANTEDAVGELVNTTPGDGFEGYYRNEEARASKVRGGIYWSGDLAYRDDDGWFYFAGRSNEWLRVDGENFAAAPVERIVLRHPEVRSAAVYAVPDDPVGDRVMVAVEVDDVDAFDVERFDEFVLAQRDLGPKWVPRFVRRRLRSCRSSPA